MKRTVKIIFSLILVSALIFSFAGCAKISYVFDGTAKAISEVKSGEWKNVPAAEETANAEDSDPAVIDALEPGTYGGVEFKTVEDVVNYYGEAYNITKPKTAKYKDEEGKVVDLYAFADQKKLEVNDILVEGSSNAVINKLIPQLLDALYVPTTGGLHPCNAREPENDVDENGESLLTFRGTAEDVVEANVTDNGDGTVTLVIQPKMTSMSRVGMDSQGKFFTTLNDIGAVVEAVSAFSWASGTTEENCKVIYKGGTVTVKIDTASKEIVEAHYHMIAYVDIKHANIAVVRDKSLSAVVDYNCDFPCSKEYFDKINVHPVD